MCDEFHDNNSIWIKKNSWNTTLHFGLSCRGFFFLPSRYRRLPGGGISLQFRIVQETSCLVSSYDHLVEKCRIIVSTTDQVTTNPHANVTLVLRQDTWHIVLGNRRHFQISQNFVARTMANLYCCCEEVYRLVHRCGPAGSMRACHAAGPGSIPGRDKFPGWGFFGVFPHL